MTNNLKNKKILILGFSTTGIASAKYFISTGADVYISEYSEMQEKNKENVDKLKNLGIKIEFNGHSEEFINNADLIICHNSDFDIGFINSEFSRVGKEVVFKDEE